MCADNYKYLCSVSYEDNLFAALIDGHHVSPGDYVKLNIGVLGKVERVVFVDTTSEDYQFLTDFVQVDEITEVYHKRWSKEEESDGNS